MKKRIFALLLVLVLFAASTTGALAAGKASITFPTHTGILYVGQLYQLYPRLNGIHANNLFWASSNSRVMTVFNGLLHGVSEGLAYVGARNWSEMDICGVLVIPRVMVLHPGELHQLPYNSAIQYISQNDTVVMVNRTGLVGAVREGITAIGVRCGNAFSIIAVQVKA